ncbi:MAG: hypothetical protein ACTHQ3_15740 [Motilibacteraceae bacterium]
MATVHHFGTDVDPSHFVEVPGTLDPDGSGNVTAPRRPAAGTVLKARDASTLAALPDITTDDYGYWSYTTTDVPQIQVSGDGGSTWVGPLISAEGKVDSLNAGANASTALQTATSADQKATQALAAAGTGGQVTIEGVTASTFTLAQINARDARVQIPVAEVSGAASTWDDIAPSAPPMPILGADGKIPASYIPASVGSGGYFVYQNADGTWPARTTVTSDPTTIVTYVMQYDVTKEPTIGADTSTAYAQDLTATPKVPGDQIEVRLPL